jgi:hypothetical protein
MLLTTNALHGAELSLTNWESRSNNNVNVQKLLCHAHISQFILQIFIIVKFPIFSLYLIIVMTLHLVFCKHCEAMYFHNLILMKNNELNF